MDNIYNKIAEGFDFFVKLYEEFGKVSTSYNDGYLTYEHPDFGVILTEEV